MINKVTIKYNLIEDKYRSCYYNNDNWHISFENISHPQFDENVLFFTIIKDSNSYFTIIYIKN